MSNSRFIAVSDDESTLVFVRDGFDPKALASTVQQYMTDQNNSTDIDPVEDIEGANGDFEAPIGQLALTPTPVEFSPNGAEVEDSVAPEQSGMPLNRKLLKIRGNDETQYVTERYAEQTPHEVAKHALLTARIRLGDGARCTGTLIYKNIVLTSAHCFIDKDKTFRQDRLDGAVAQFEVYNNIAKREAKITAIQYLNYNGLLETEGYHRDYVLATLDKPMGNKYGWAGIKATDIDFYTDYSQRFGASGFTLVGSPVMTIVGFHGFDTYPCDSKPCYQTDSIGDCKLGGWIKKSYGWLVRSTCDTEAGGSGSSYIEHQHGSAYVVALHMGGDHITNLAVPCFEFVNHFINLRNEVDRNAGFGLTGDLDEIPPENPTFSTAPIGL